MTNVETILVVFLSSFLALFLVLGCVVLVKTIQILDHLKSISERAEKLADTAEHVGEFVRYSAAPVALAKLFTTVNDHVFNKSKHNNRGKDESQE